MIDKNFQAWSLANSVSFYVSERNRVKDLYRSEAAMLLPAMPYVRSVLDVGCAAGGFADLFKELDPKIAYTGVDTSAGMVEEACRLRPDVDFRLSTGGRLPFADDSFDLVLCTGVLNHNPDYLDMIADLFRVAKRFAVIDLPRLVTGPYTFDLDRSNMVLKERFHGAGNTVSAEQTRVPYVLVNVGEAFERVAARLKGDLAGIACMGYYGKTDASVTIPYPEVIFTVVLLAKGSGGTTYALDLPADARPMAEVALKNAGGRDAGSTEGMLAQVT